MVIGAGFSDRYLTTEETCDLVKQALDSLAVDDKRVLVLIPDGTRTMPMPLMAELFKADRCLS